MVGALVMRFEMRPADFCILFSASASEILPADINLSVRRTRSTVHPFRHRKHEQLPCFHTSLPPSPYKYRGGVTAY